MGHVGRHQLIREHGSIPLVDWGSWDYCCGTTQPAFSLAAIAAGQHDAYLKQWAAAAAAWGHPLFLRFDGEMNGAWEEWSEQVNGNQPGDFVLMWRHVHDIFVQAGASNVSFVWCPNIEGVSSTPLKGLYPGASYVDWTGLDGYNWGTDYGNIWQTFAQVFSGSAAYGNFNSYRDVLALAPDKPLLLGEVASSEHGGSKAKWITDMLSRQLSGGYQGIRGFVWFNSQAGDPTLTWPIESSAAATAAFKTALASQYYAANDFGQLGGTVISGYPPASAAASSNFSQPRGATATAETSTLSPAASPAANSSGQASAIMAAHVAYLRAHPRRWVQ